MSHGDEVFKMPNGFEVMVTSEQGAFEHLVCAESDAQRGGYLKCCNQQGNSNFGYYAMRWILLKKMLIEPWRSGIPCVQFDYG
nr:hypothetical protein [Tanacetum cinerariifolium]